jgi:hypothetical protein
MNFPKATVIGEFKVKKGRKNRKEAILSHLSKALELIHDEKYAGRIAVGGERWQMYSDWYNQIDDVRLEMAGVI